MLFFTLWACNRSSWIDTSQRLNAILDWDKLPGCEWNIHLPFQILKKRDIFPIYLCTLLRNNRRRMNCWWWKEMQWTGGPRWGQVNLPLHQSTPLTALSLYSCPFESGCTNEMMNGNNGLQSNHSEPVCQDNIPKIWAKLSGLQKGFSETFGDFKDSQQGSFQNPFHVSHLKQ